MKSPSATMTKVCKNCDNSFESPRWRKYKFCSVKCACETNFKKSPRKVGIDADVKKKIRDLYVAGKTYKEIMSEAGVSVATVWKYKGKQRPSKCVVCGKLFANTHRSKSCSPECKKKRDNKRQVEYVTEKRVSAGAVIVNRDERVRGLAPSPKCKDRRDRVYLYKRECDVCGKSFRANLNEKYCSDKCMVGRRKKKMAGRVSDLSDSYVRQAIRQQYGVSGNIPGALIEVKRNLIKLKRLNGGYCRNKKPRPI